MTALNYKDFQGSVEFEDNRLVIRVLHIDDLVTTEVDSAQKAQSAFEELVDDYVETCTQLGKKCCKPFKGSFNVRVAPELHRQVAMAAADVGESLNSWVSGALAARLDRHKTKKAMLSHDFAVRVFTHEDRTTTYRHLDTPNVTRVPSERVVRSIIPYLQRRQMN
jgi:predicted HicB family RNase H-like nuclease